MWWHERRPLQAHTQGEQRLDDAVVQLLRDPLAILENGEALDRLLGLTHCSVSAACPPKASRT